MAARSYVCPSIAVTGSAIAVCVTGHRNAFDAAAALARVSFSERAAAAAFAAAAARSARSSWCAASMRSASEGIGAPAAASSSRTARANAAGEGPAAATATAPTSADPGFPPSSRVAPFEARTVSSELASS